MQQPLSDTGQEGDGGRLLDEVADLEDRTAARRFVDAVADERPAEEARPLISGPGADRVRRRAVWAAERLEAVDPLVQMRGLAALALATGDRSYDDRAFELLASIVSRGTARQARRDQATRRPRIAGPSGVRVSAAARIDFGGGWTDTPPRSIERGGTVLNAAVTLRGAYPIVAEAAWLASGRKPRLILESREIRAVYEPSTVGDLMTHNDPADPFALHKAALVLCGLTPLDADLAAPATTILAPFRRGLRLSTMSSIPRGSGLGTSSIMAGAVLASLRGLLEGESPDWRDPDTAAGLFDEVLCLEQMMTTGGGWQDQVGGLTGGMKLVRTQPGLPQRIAIEPVALAEEIEDALRRRLVLIYTGQQRLAKDLLRQVMRRWMLREPEIVWILDEIGRLALAMQEAVRAGDLDTFGALLGEHWALNKRMHPGCTNPFIDALFEHMAPYICGGKLAGAGGGGFAIVLARNARATLDLATMLRDRYPDASVALWPSAIPEAGLVVEPLNDAGEPERPVQGPS